MIRIPTYKEHRNGDAIFDIYLYLAALVLPFAPSDVLGKNKLVIAGKTIDADNFIEKSKKEPRRRTEDYTALLGTYGLTDIPQGKKERFKQDELLALHIIRESSEPLYKYLYIVNEDLSSSEAVPKMNRKNLRVLLTTKMDELSDDLLKIGVVQKDILLKEIFRYETFSDKKELLDLLKLMDVSVCPYCNRQYTYTISEGSGSSRPQLDHYKAKKDYPYLAISLLNLVPSCGLCNQAKGDKKKSVLYPYSDEMGYDITFRTKMKTDINYLFGSKDAVDEFEVLLEQNAPDLDGAFIKRFKNSKELFHLTELYNGHKDYILYLFWKNYVFGDEYLDMLCAEFPDMFSTREEVKSLLYLMDIDKEHWGKRVLGKLTHDMDLEIK